MPKRQGNLFNKMFTPEALYQAYLRARKSKRNKFAVHEFEKDLGYNLNQLHIELHTSRYMPRPYKTFQVFEPKPRQIHAPDFRDVVVQHAMYYVLYPIIDKTLCFESYGCRKYKGTHRAANRAQQFLRQSSIGSYTLQLDIRKFFYKIDRKILLNLWSKKIKDLQVLDLISKFGEYSSSIGIPIGNLISQLSALVYLNPLDQFIKRELKVSKYVRYVDDFILFNLTKEQANVALMKITSWLKFYLNLELSKFILKLTSTGINFVGFRTWLNTRLVRKHSLYKFNKNIKLNNIDSIVSHLGHAKHSGSFGYFISRLSKEVYNKLPKSMKVGTHEYNI